MKMLLRFATLAVAALVFCAGSVYAQPKEKVVLMLNWYLYSEHAPFFLGKERGYYDQEGIESRYPGRPRLGRHRTSGGG